MHQPRPYGRFANGELSAEDTVAVDSLARSLTNARETGILVDRRVVDLPSGRVAVADAADGTFRIRVLDRQQYERELPSGLAEFHVPMLFSGVITNAVLRERQGLGMRLTRQTVRRLSGYETKTASTKDVELQRFRIEYPDAYAFFKPSDTGIFKHMLYQRFRPTWWSGAMAQVVQIVMGYGRQDFKALPEDPVERARMKIPDRWQRKIRKELTNSRLPGYLGLPAEDGKPRYDFLFSNSDAVSFDVGGAPWLVRISAAGVHAMPLPMIPATTTEAFRGFVEEVEDAELLAILDRFGGMPSGESFPRKTEDFEAWRRAGVIIKVCDDGGFYAGKWGAYSLCCWSMNSKGARGVNTCWSRDGSKLLHAHTYRIVLELGAAKKRGVLPLEWDLSALDWVARGRLDAYLGAIYKAAAGNSAKNLAIKYKLRRQPLTEVMARIGRQSAEAEVAYWDNFEAKPIASHAGRIGLMESGPVYVGGKNPKNGGGFKVPFIDAAGVMSVKLISPEYTGGPVKCDTIVHAAYLGDELNVVRYFHDERKFQQATQSTFEENMIVGSWEETVTTGLSGLMGSFHTTAFDDRQVQDPSVTTTKLTGTDKGYGQPAFLIPGIFDRVGGIYRYRYYQHKTESTTRQNFSIATGIVVPVFCRDAILYGYVASGVSRSFSMKTEMFGMKDPNSYQLWTHDNLYHYLGFTLAGNVGDPYPKQGVPVYADTYDYSPTGKDDFADSGNWFGVVTGQAKDITSICGAYTFSGNGVIHAGGALIGGEAPSFKPQSAQSSTELPASGRVKFSIAEDLAGLAHERVPDSWYFEFSPSDDGNFFYRDATRNAIGQAAYASISETDDSGQRVHRGATVIADHRSAHCFIGVINE